MAQNQEFDNCSTDESLEIPRRYVDKDERIRIHNNEQHVGVIENHNIALKRMSHQIKYCKVVHPDDRLFPKCIGQMIKLAKANSPVGIVSGYVLRGDGIS